MSLVCSLSAGPFASELALNTELCFLAGVWPLVTRLVRPSFGGVAERPLVCGPYEDRVCLLNLLHGNFQPHQSSAALLVSVIRIFTLPSPRVTLLPFSVFDTTDLLETHSFLGFKTTRFPPNSLNILDSFADSTSSQWLNVRTPQALSLAFSLLSAFSF